MWQANYSISKEEDKLYNSNYYTKMTICDILFFLNTANQFLGLNQNLRMQTRFKIIWHKTEQLIEISDYITDVFNC